MCTRFVTTLIHEHSHSNQGIFSGAYSLLNSGSLDHDEWNQLPELLIWLNKNLPTPPDSFPVNHALFRFESSAKSSIQRIWELVHLPRHHGYHVQIHNSRRLGNICLR
jgi:hypothetical protein